jgi:hypothetical protein
MHLSPTPSGIGRHGIHAYRSSTPGFSGTGGQSLGILDRIKDQINSAPGLSTKSNREPQVAPSNTSKTESSVVIMLASRPLKRLFGNVVGIGIMFGLGLAKKEASGVPPD